MLWWLWLKRDVVWQSMLPGHKFGPDQPSWFSRERVSGVPDNVIYTCTSLAICPGCTMRCMWNQCVPTMGAKQRGRILETAHGDKLLKPQSLFYIIGSVWTNTDAHLAGKQSQGSNSILLFKKLTMNKKQNTISLKKYSILSVKL